MHIYIHIYIYIDIYIYIYCNGKKAINVNCLNVDDPLLQCKKDSQGVISNT